jgi:hypothetical protein
MAKSISANFQGDAKSDNLGLILTSNSSGHAQNKKDTEAGRQAGKTHITYN